MALLQVVDVVKTFRRQDGSSVHALGPVSLDVKEGEFVSIVGPSGCGKSTLLNLVAGLSPATSGSIVLKGQQVTRPSRDVSMVFQRPVLLPWRRIQSNIALPLEIADGRKGRTGRSKKVSELLSLVGLPGIENAYPRELSGGMQQRVAIARALLPESPCMLMDEPFGAVDALTREELNIELENIFRVARRTVLMITHSIQEAVFLSDRVIVMSTRPGVIIGETKIDLKRPRELEMETTTEFVEACAHVRSLLDKGSGRSRSSRTDAVTSVANSPLRQRRTGGE
jgi:NitT/TauT family transport system ATP-binding protein